MIKRMFFSSGSAAIGVQIYRLPCTLVNTEYLMAFTHKQERLSQDNVHLSDDKSSLSVMWNELDHFLGCRISVLFHTQLVKPRSTMTCSFIECLPEWVSSNLLI